MIVKKKLVFLGAPGTGKGTLSELLKTRLSFKHLSTGDLFRSMINAKNHLGELLNSYMQEGKYVPDELTNQVVKEALSATKEHNVDECLILDGYPRTLDQAKYLHTLIEVDAAILLDAVNVDLIVDRITNRLVCMTCHRVYNQEGERKPKQANLCDDDNSLLVSRKDDNREVVYERIKQYQTSIQPVIDYYKNANLLHTIDAATGIENLYAQALAILEGKA